MWDNDNGESSPGKATRPLRGPSMDPLEKALRQLAVKERKEIAEIVRREIERPTPTKVISD